MRNDFRALCAELLDEFVYHTDWSDAEELKDRARAALAEPEPELEPTDDELFAVAEAYAEDNGLIGLHNAPDFARAVLARWGNSAPQPPADGEVAECAAELEEQKPRPDYDRVQKIATEAQIRSAAQYLAKKQHCDGDLIPAIRYAIARWGNPTPQPVPVGVRPWEREEWCDPNGLCWLGSLALDGSTPTWLFGPPAWAERFPNVHRVLLPAHALPLPEVGE